MEPLRTVDSSAVSLPIDDIDTDIIYPARFLLITEKKGLGGHAFADRRGDDGFPIGPDGVGAAQIMVCGRNFGCGSSREQAVWTLADLGLRVLIAPSFGEIFYSNCFKNGVLPIRLAEADCALAHAGAQAGARFVVSLEDCTITIAGAAPLSFDVGPDQRESLLNGWNEIARIRALHLDDIAQFETAQRAAEPWLWIKEQTHA